MLNSSVRRDSSDVFEKDRPIIGSSRYTKSEIQVETALKNSAFICPKCKAPTNKVLQAFMNDVLCYCDKCKEGFYKGQDSDSVSPDIIETVSQSMK